MLGALTARSAATGISAARRALSAAAEAQATIEAFTVEPAEPTSEAGAESAAPRPPKARLVTPASRAEAKQKAAAAVKAAVDAYRAKAQNKLKAGEWQGAIDLAKKQPKDLQKSPEAQAAFEETRAAWLRYPPS